MSTGDALSAVLASASIPGVLPTVEREGLALVDGGVSDNAALSQAVALGADEIYVLPAGFACALQRPPASALASAVQALTLLIEQRLVMEVGQFRDRSRIKVLPPLCPLSVSSADFSQASELIRRSHHETGRWLDSGGPSLPAPERFLSLHHHSKTRTDRSSGEESVAEGADSRQRGASRPGGNIVRGGHVEQQVNAPEEDRT